MATSDHLVTEKLAASFEKLQLGLQLKASHRFQVGETSADRNGSFHPSLESSDDTNGGGWIQVKSKRDRSSKTASSKHNILASSNKNQSYASSTLPNAPGLAPQSIGTNAPARSFNQAASRKSSKQCDLPKNDFPRHLHTRRPFAWATEKPSGTTVPNEANTSVSSSQSLQCGHTSDSFRNVEQQALGNTHSGLKVEVTTPKKKKTKTNTKPALLSRVKKFGKAREVDIRDFIVPRAQSCSATPRAVTSTKLRKNLPQVNEFGVARRGKEREHPKAKKPTPLKRKIMRDRDIRLQARSTSAPPSEYFIPTSEVTPATPVQMKGDFTEDSTFLSTPREPGSGAQSLKILRSNVMQLKDSTAGTALVESMLDNLATFQDRNYQENLNKPFQFKRAKRLVCGFSEVLKHLKVNRLKVIFIANNLEGGASKSLFDSSGADENSKSHSIVDLLCKIRDMAINCDPPVPVLVTHSRYRLARLCHKRALVSVVGVLQVAGVESTFKQLQAVLSANRLKVELDSSALIVPATFSN